MGLGQPCLPFAFVDEGQMRRFGSSFLVLWRIMFIIMYHGGHHAVRLRRFFGKRQDTMLSVYPLFSR